MKVLTEIFKISHPTGFSDWENDNNISAKLIHIILKLKKDFIVKYNTTNIVFLISEKLYYIINSNRSFKWSNAQYPNPAHILSKTEGYYYGGTLMGVDIYYNMKCGIIPDKIYCSDSIDEIYKYMKKEERKRKLNKINKKFEKINEL